MTFAEIFASDFLIRIVIRALIVGVLVSICSSVLGVILVLKRQSMIGDGLSHVGFLGLALAAVAGVGATFSMEISIPVVIIAAILIQRLSKNNGKMNGDAACAVVSTGAVAVGTLLYNFTGGRAGDICSSLFGSASIITISNKDMIISVVLGVIVLLWFVGYEKLIFTMTFDETFAKASGVTWLGFDLTRWFGVSLAILTGFTIVVGMKMMGSIMISALIIFPALTAMRLTKSFRLTVILSAAISVVCFLVGFFGACLLSLQTGAAVVTVELAVFAVVCLVSAIKPKKAK